MKEYRVSIYYSDLVDAENEDDAVDELYNMVCRGLIKKHEWEFDVQKSE
jgi:hypothetical protein